MKQSYMIGRPGSQDRGFSLVEILVVLLIVAILAVGGFYALRSYQATARLRLAAQEIASNLRFARTLATSSSGSAFAFDFGGSSISGYSIRDADGRLQKKIILPEGVTLAIPGWGTTITFAANGSSDVGGSMVLSSTTVSKTITVTLTKETGMVVLTE